MAKDNQILVRVNDPTYKAIEQFAEDRDYNKAEAVRRITESRLRSEGLLSRQFYGEDDKGNVIPARLEPVLRASDYLANGGAVSLFAGLISWVALVTNIIPPTVFYVVSTAVLTFFGFLTIMAGVILFLIAIVLDQTVSESFVDHGRKIDIRQVFNRWVTP